MESKPVSGQILPKLHENEKNWVPLRPSPPQSANVLNSVQDSKQENENFDDVDIVLVSNLKF